jgi:hypothetical protein
MINIQQETIYMRMICWCVSGLLGCRVELKQKSNRIAGLVIHKLKGELDGI